MTRALILVDIQNDFMPNGALPVEEGDQILPIVNRLLDHPFDFKIATKDWHPVNHSSFANNHQKLPGEQLFIEGFLQTLWPVHCVQNESGAEFANGWNSHLVDKTILKGTDPTIDSYSTFYDNGHRRSTQLEEYLKQHQVKEVYIAGLATDYCVKFSVLDALKAGFRTFVVLEGCRGVNLYPQDVAIAVQEMIDAGAEMVNMDDVKLHFFAKK